MQFPGTMTGLNQNKSQPQSGLFSSHQNPIQNQPANMLQQGNTLFSQKPPIAPSSVNIFPQTNPINSGFPAPQNNLMSNINPPQIPSQNQNQNLTIPQQHINQAEIQELNQVLSSYDSLVNETQTFSIYRSFVFSPLSLVF